MKQALIVGINDYPGSGNDLPSCRKDCVQFSNYLGNIGFNITRLLDADASAANVNAEIEVLCDRKTRDDRIVFYFSGHGHQVAEDGNLEEVLVLHDDFLWDDHLTKATSTIPPGIMTAVIDACHSGGMEKHFVGGQIEVPKVKAWTPNTRLVASRDLIHGRRFGAVKRFGHGTIRGDADEISDRRLNALLIAACSENEKASASTSQTNGLSAFTYCLLEVLAEHRSENTPQGLLLAVTARLRQLGFRQTPVLRMPVQSSSMDEMPFWTMESGHVNPSSPPLDLLKALIEFESIAQSR